MRTIAHVSDLHFGREDPALVAALQEDLKGAAPDLVAVSGDLTQRARRREFEAARDFLQALGMPMLAVPGNHDIPLFDVARRLLRPLDRYRQYIHADDNPFYVDAELAVLVHKGRVEFLSQFRRCATPEIRVPLEVARCDRCGLVQLTVVVDPEVLFRDYAYSTSASR